MMSAEKKSKRGKGARRGRGGRGGAAHDQGDGFEGEMVEVKVDAGT